MTTDFTHEPNRHSWIESATKPETDFPLQNLPYGVFQSERHGPHLGVAIGDLILDLSLASEAHLLPPEFRDVSQDSSLNPLMALRPAAWSRLRRQLSDLLGADTCSASRRDEVMRCLVSQSSATMLLPARIGDYTDFYASIHHASHVGAMFRPEQPLLPNYKWVPIGYHGRSSSIVISGATIRRPHGQIKLPEASPVFAPTRQLDYELELGAFIGPGNPQGDPIPLAFAGRHLFGIVLLNDWSARDLQAWEYQPLGPFLAKNFATTISPWVVTMEALAPFRVPAAPRPDGDPVPLPYLADTGDQTHGGLDLTLEVWLRTPSMRTAGTPPHRLTSGNFRQMYWTLAQLLTHHASNGCNLCPGDLLGSGTVSGDTPGSRGCLLELTTRGKQPLVLPNGEERRFLQDGDEIILRGYAERPGFRRIGLGECRGTIGPPA